MKANALVAKHLSEIGVMPTNAMNVSSDLYSLASLRGVRMCWTRRKETLMLCMCGLVWFDISKQTLLSWSCWGFSLYGQWSREFGVLFGASL